MGLIPARCVGAVLSDEESLAGAGPRVKVRNVRSRARKHENALA